MSVVEIKSVDIAKLESRLGSGRVIVGVDVAKREQYVAILDENGEAVLLLRWRMPDELPVFVGLLVRLGRDRVEVAMEPSGTYGEPMRHALVGAGIAVFRVSGKRLYDAREVLDGMPSLHDKKAAVMLGWMHGHGFSSRWALESDGQRDLKAATALLEIAAQAEMASVNRIEAMLARHWPEATGHLSLKTASLIKLLAAFGGPASVAARESESSALLRGTGKRLLAVEKVEALLSCAASTVGVPMTSGEDALLRELATQVLAARDRQTAAGKTLKALTKDNTSASRIAVVVGPATAAVMTADLGDIASYTSAKALQKTTGLNLKEKSSGTKQGHRTLTKRGPSRVRRWLYLAALRLIQHDEVARAWYLRKVARDGGSKMRAVIAVMRKLLRALWHVARGAAFDSTKLFDVRRLTTA
jgi:transposase